MPLNFEPRESRRRYHAGASVTETDARDTRAANSLIRFLGPGLQEERQGCEKTVEAKGAQNCSTTPICDKSIPNELPSKGATYTAFMRNCAKCV